MTPLETAVSQLLIVSRLIERALASDTKGWIIASGPHRGAVHVLVEADRVVLTTILEALEETLVLEVDGFATLFRPTPFACPSTTHVKWDLFAQVVPTAA